MFPERIERESVVLMRLADVDVFDLYDLFVDGSETARDVFEYIPQEPFATVEDARGWVTAAQIEWEERESARYAVCRSDDTLVGVAVLDLAWDRRVGSHRSSSRDRTGGRGTPWRPHGG